MQRLADDAARQHVLHRHALLVVGLGVVGGVLAVRRSHGGHLRRRGAVVVHVAHEGGAEHLAGALPAVGAVVQHVARDRHRRAGTRAADAHLGVAVHGAEDDDGLAHAGLDHADGDADQRLGRGAAAEHVHVEVEADAEVAGDEGRRRWSRPTGRTACRRRRRPSARRRGWRCAPPRCRARAWSCRSRACRWSRPPRRWRTCPAECWGSRRPCRPASGMGRDPPVVLFRAASCRVAGPRVEQSSTMGRAVSEAKYGQVRSSQIPASLPPG